MLTVRHGPLMEGFFKQSRILKEGPPPTCISTTLSLLSGLRDHSYDRLSWSSVLWLPYSVTEFRGNWMTCRQTDGRTATANLKFSFCSCANRNVNRWERIWPDRTGSCVGDGPVVLGFVNGQRGLRGVGRSVRVGHRQAERT